jgi:hypothetical protein
MVEVIVARQDYFIEVIHNDTSVTSAVMPVSVDASLRRWKWE